MWDRFALPATDSEAKAISPQLLGCWSLINRLRWRMALLVQTREVVSLGDPVKWLSVVKLVFSALLSKDSLLTFRPTSLYFYLEMQKKEEVVKCWWERDEFKVLLGLSWFPS